AALAPVVKGVASLHNFFKKPMISHFTPVRQEQGHLVRVPNPELTTSRGDHFLAPADFATIYDINPLLNTTNGSGQTIAIVGRSNIGNDVAIFRQTFGLAPNTTNVIVNGLDPGDVPGDDVEAILDTEWSGAVAPGATIDLVVSASTLTTDGVDLSASFIVDNNLAPIMSVSFGQCEKLLGVQENAFFNSLWQQAAAQGISVFVSAGDNGAAGCDDPNPNTTPATGGLAVSGLASTPFNTAVGGTEFNETVNGNTAANFWNSTNGLGFESAKGYIPEMVWNESCSPGQAGTDCAGQTFFELFAGSGGASSLYSKPSWQSTSITGVPNDGARDLPDVSLTAAGHDGYIICFQEDPTIACQVSGGVLVQAAVVGGTSASSPSFAGIMALIDQKVGGRQGLANYVLYNLALNKENFSNCNSSNRTNPGTGTSCIFNDTTAGNNNVPGQTGSSAGTGYDLASGLGSVDANNLATAWGNATFQATVTSITTSMGATVNITHGQSITLTGQVQKSPSGAGPTGSIAFVTDQPGPQGGFLTVGAGGLSGSPASFSQSFSNLPGGTYNLSAHYPGDGTFAASDSAGIPVNVAKENSSTSLKVTLFNVNTGVVPLVPVAYGDPNNILVFDGTAGASSGNGFPSGNIVFKDGSTAIGTVPMNNVADAEAFNCFTPITCLTIGTHNITATYPNGDNSFNASGPSSAVSITITKGNPAVFLTAPATAGSGVAFTLTATINTGLGTINPTGTVQFKDGTTALGSPATVSGGTASTQATLNSGGSHNITAQYSGDSTYNAATSASSAVNVTAPFSFSAVLTSQTIPAGGTANYNVTLLPIGGFSGAVSFNCTGAPGGATCTVSPNPANVTPTTVSVPLTVTVSNTTNARLTPNQFRTMPFVFAGVLAVMLVGLRKKPKQRVLLVLGLFVIAGIASCGGGGGSTPIQRPPTNATLTVTGTSGSNSSSIMLNLTVTH
ncbi:MAG TPA: Ig-like domain repeat protein, partial [Candidatus Angelobacter sp.]